MNSHSTPPDGLTRRQWLGGGLALGGLLEFGLPGVATAMPPGGKPQVSFHMDQPYWDQDGTAQPYRPPAGLRGAAILQDMDEEAMRRLSPFH